MKDKMEDLFLVLARFLVGAQVQADKLTLSNEPPTGMHYAQLYSAVQDLKRAAEECGIPAPLPMELDPPPVLQEVVYPDPPPTGMMWVRIGDKHELRGIDHVTMVTRFGGQDYPARGVPSPALREGEEVVQMIGTDVPMIIKVR